MNNCGISFNDNDVLIISGKSNDQIFNKIKEYGWLKDHFIDTLNKIEISNNQNVISQYKTIFTVDQEFVCKNKFNNVSLMFSSAFRVNFKENVGYVLPFSLLYKDHETEYNYDTLGLVIGWLDGHNVFREFIYHDHTEFYYKYKKIKLIEPKSR